MTTPKTGLIPPGSFSLFPLFPIELQDLIWDQAAALSPQIHFFLNAHHAAHSPHHNLWCSTEAPLNLLPHVESGALNTVSLSQACRAAHAAVQRYTKGIAKKTFLRTSIGPAAAVGVSPFSSVPSPLAPRPPSLTLILDLQQDLVCFGGPDADGGGVWDVVDWGEGNHLLFSAARRFAVRYRPGWEKPGPGPLGHDLRCPGGWVRGQGGERGDGEGMGGFCSRCMTRLVEKFLWLEEFYLVIDEGDVGEGLDGGGENEAAGWDGLSREKRLFNSYSRTYFTPDMSKPSSGIKEATEVLQRMRCNMLDPERFPTGWIMNIKLGLLTWKGDGVSQ
ncbi:hypothetical protein C8A05DRAFT_15312 [Staphylotrichum tortipilum]|uniref:2EXR domain-containing protein n=1 Tax=Staphylotrichum tortipilum TaxID=2831512 RepID=A0AAN6MMF2_9PEZI|nr:hypothetical protein C8A05DRAFT_15312 [Staphylotrichum longicolle]